MQTRYDCIGISVYEEANPYIAPQPVPGIAPIIMHIVYSPGRTITSLTQVPFALITTIVFCLVYGNVIHDIFVLK